LLSVIAAILSENPPFAGGKLLGPSGCFPDSPLKPIPDRGPEGEAPDCDPEVEFPDCDPEVEAPDADPDAAGAGETTDVLFCEKVIPASKMNIKILDLIMRDIYLFKLSLIL